jgi:acyl-CoA reductase-like NAD-dependent aldehyde dehydrogenase
MSSRDELNLIGGTWRAAASAQWCDVEDPSTGEVINRVPRGGAPDADAAAAAAREAFDHGPWPRLRPAERAARLRELATLLSSRAEQLTDLVVRDAGCPTRLAGFLQIGVPIGHLETFAEQTALLRATAHPIPEQPFGLSEVHREPVGVCVGFTPYNFPLFMAIWKFGAAAAMGNTVILKPSPLAPLATNELARACAEAGIPPGVINVVHGDAEAGEALVAHPDVDMVSFTGSTGVGRRIMAVAAGTIKKLTLELGGKSACVILDDADLELAVRGACFGTFPHAGQGCVCTGRVLVPRSRYDEVLDLIVERAGAITVGEASSPTSDIGPLISAAQLRKVEGYLNSASDQGAKVVVGGGRPGGLPGGGHYLEPTVLAGVTPDMTVACEEIFGPVMSVIAYRDDDEAVAIANGTIYGLAASVWGSDLRRARAVGSRMRAGSVWINDFGVVSPLGPFGGYKQSGLGRELSAEGTLEYTELKHLYTALDQDVRTRPYGLLGSAWNSAD